MQFDTFNAKEFKEIIMQKMLNQYPKFTLKLKQKFLEHWWLKVPIEEAINKVLILPRMKNEEEVINHMREEINVQIDIFNDLPYEFHLIPYEANKGVVLLKFDHLMSDGLGIISCLCASASNYSFEIFPKLMQNVTKDQWYILLLNWSLFPFVFIYNVYVQCSLIITNNPLRVKKEDSIGKSVFDYSKSYSIRSFDEYKKKHKLSFNDVMMTAISIALGKIKHMNPNNAYSLWNNATVFLPVGRKPLPKTAESVNVNNDFSVAVCKIPLISNAYAPGKIQESIRKYFKGPIQFCHNKTLAIFGSLLTWRLIRIFTEFVVQRFDLVFTNVPGPVTPLNYNGFICQKMLAFPAAGHAIPFLPLISYNHSFRFSIVLDEGSAIKPCIVIEKLEEALEEIITNQIDLQ